MRNDIPTKSFPYYDLETNITFGELQEMSYDDCASFVDRMRNELLELWNDGIPPYVGIEMKEIISRFKKLNEYDISEFYVEDELYNDYDGFIRNFTKIATSVNQFFPAILKSRINGYSIYDYLSNENLWSDFRYTIVQKVRFDKMFSYSSYLVNTAPGGDEEFFLDWYNSSDKHFWFEDYNFNQMNEKLGRVRLPSDFVKNTLKQTKYRGIHTNNRKGFNQDGDERYYTIRYYEKDQRLFPKMFQVLRLGLGQVATNFPPLTARWIYEKYLPPLSRDEFDYYCFTQTKNPKVFDSSAGWGGRLLGSLCSNYPIHYIGLDVNQSNKGCYESLGEFYNSKCGFKEITLGEVGLREWREEQDFISTNLEVSEGGEVDYTEYPRGDYYRNKPLKTNPINEPNTFEIHYKGSEVIGDDKDFMDKHKGDVDLCFTSPPYFNKEIYSDDKEQSSTKFPNYDDWLNGFLEPTIKTYYDLLKENRYCLINIADLKIGKDKFYPLEQDTIQLAIKCGFEYHRKYGMVMTRMIGTNPSDMRNSWLDVKSQKTYKVENILIFKKPTIIPWDVDD